MTYMQSFFKNNPRLHFLIYLIRDKDMRNLHNLALSKYNQLVRNHLVTNQPVSAQLSITNYCNLSCTKCGNSRLTKRKSMSFDEFCRIYSKLSHVPVFIISGIGENFLNKDVIRMLSLLKENHKFVSLTSNFSVITKEHIESLVRLKIDEVYASLDIQADQDLENSSTSDNFLIAVEKIKYLVKKRGEFSSSLPVIKIRTILFPQAEKEQYRSIIRLAEDIGIDNIEFSPFIASDNGRGNSHLTQLKPLVSEIEEIKSTVHYRFLPFSKKSFQKCVYPYYGLYISEFGEVLPCCWKLHDPEYEDFLHEKRYFGNILQQSLADVWNGRGLKTLRNSLAQNTPHHFCRDCIIYGNH